MLEVVGQQAAGSIDQLFINWSTLSAWQLNGTPALILVFNAALLVVPYLLMVALAKLWRYNRWHGWSGKLSAAVLWLLWLLFFPNAAYLIMDVRHLSGLCPANAYVVCPAIWQVLIFFLVGLVGYLAFVVLLAQAQAVAKRAWGSWLAHILLLLYVPIMSLGVLLGLFERFSSWQALMFPRTVWQSALAYSSGWRLTLWLTFSAEFIILYYFGLAVGHWLKKKL